MSRALDRINVRRVDWAVGMLRGVLGFVGSSDLHAELTEAIQHVRGAARVVERAQRARRKAVRGPRPHRKKKA